MWYAKAVIWKLCFDVIKVKFSKYFNWHEICRRERWYLWYAYPYTGTSEKDYLEVIRIFEFSSWPEIWQGWFLWYPQHCGSNTSLKLSFFVISIQRSIFKVTRNTRLVFPLRVTTGLLLKQSAYIHVAVIAYRCYYMWPQSYILKCHLNSILCLYFFHQILEKLRAWVDSLVQNCIRLPIFCKLQCISKPVLVVNFYRLGWNWNFYKLFINFLKLSINATRNYNVVVVLVTFIVIVS